MRDGDRGSITPMILLFFLIAALVVMGTTAAGTAFLAQRNLQSVCDSAVIAAADGLDPAVAYRDDVEFTSGLPLTEASVEAAVGRFAEEGYADEPGLTLTATTDGHTATVVCRRTVDIPFGALFGHPDGLETSTAASARAPITRG